MNCTFINSMGGKNYTCCAGNKICMLNLTINDIPLLEMLLVTLFQKLRRQPNTRISLTRSFILPKTLVSVRLTHGIIWALTRQQ